MWAGHGTLSAKSHARAMELGMWWLGKFEKIGTLAGHDVLQHTDYIEGVFCCYNVHEECSHGKNLQWN